MSLIRGVSHASRSLRVLATRPPPLTTAIRPLSSCGFCMPISPATFSGVDSFAFSSVQSKRFYSPSGSVPESLWRLGRFNHIAIAVPDLEKATAFYRDALHATISPPQALPEHGVTTVFVELDNTKLELLHPLGDNSPIAKFLQKNKSGGLHHICIEVNDIIAAMTDVTKSGIRCLGKEPKIGAHGKPVIFLHPADCNGVLLELEEA